jgi:type II secretory pathway component GspD/PulD (secretin)
LPEQWGLSAALSANATKPAPEKKKVLGDQTPCTLNVVNEDPAKILQVLSAQTQTNLMLLSGSDKKLTLNLRDVKLVDMIRHICALTGLKYLKVGETYVLAMAEGLKSAYPLEWEVANPSPPPPIPAAQVPIVTKMVLLNHISSSQIVTVLEKVFDKQVLSAVAGPVQTTPTVSAVDTQKTTGQGASVIKKDESDTGLTAKALILRGPEPLVKEAEALAHQLDVVRPQVVIEVSIWDINDSALKDLGAAWTFGDQTISEDNQDKFRFGTFQRTGLSFTATIKALEKKEQAKVLASPNISVLDGERAFILIGDRINFPVVIGYNQSGSPIFSKEEERVGIYLQVAASVATDGEITMSLYPQVSTVTGFLEVNGASYPQISTREAQSTLRIKSGETLVMGGLLKTEEVHQLEKVPILGDLPFLGELFRHRKTNKTNSQVLISIKPTVLRDEPR